MKYRIKEKRMADNRKLYTPQKKYKFIPFWLDCTTLHQGGAIITENFSTLKKAQQYIKQEKDFYMSNKIFKTIIHK